MTLEELPELQINILVNNEDQTREQLLKERRRLILYCAKLEGERGEAVKELLIPQYEQKLNKLRDALSRQAGKNTYWRNRYKRLEENYKKLLSTGEKK